MGFNRLEKDILNWYIANADDEVLRHQLTKATLKKRDDTGAGFFVNLAVPSEVPTRLADRDGINPHPGPFIESPGLNGGGDTVLFIIDSLIDTFEIFAYGDIFSGNLDVYSHKKPRVTKSL